MEKIAFIIDGGWFTKKYESEYGAFPSANNADAFIRSLNTYLKINLLPGIPTEIYRIFYYDCKPSAVVLKNPIDGVVKDLGQSVSYKNNKKLQDGLREKDYFAVRFGDLKVNEWRVKISSIKHLKARPLNANDLTPNVEQKGVDMRIGLDIAKITSKKLCSKIVLISGDHDMIPAMKTARKDGVHVILHTFDSRVMPEFSAHADVIIKNSSIGYTHS